MLGPLKGAFRGERFGDDTDIKALMRNWLETRSSFLYDDGIKKLPIRWGKCVLKAGDYIKKM